ncbi:hypothetical protein [uncultured Roseibium sp.]|uniref:hypothetical protein n=1 Tax=uncultured Roseibium sp. TaxID=1936171 RepID=UPI002609EE31|nr:hypothetical protein [uncultured Roseibium sp.]
MMVLSSADFTKLVARANLAPSVHNTQPTRWKLEDDGSISLWLDHNRCLAVGDPEGRDTRLSFGAALEGTRLALSEFGLGIRSRELLPRGDSAGIAQLAKVEVVETGQIDRHANIVGQRHTWRGGFTEATDISKRQISQVAADRDDILVIGSKPEIAALSEMNDEASLMFFSNTPYREELLFWMRLSRNHDQWAVDGLNAEAMAMSRLEAFGAGIVLRTPVFKILKALHLASGLVSEKKRSMTSSAILLFHRPYDEDPLDNGVAFYGLLLALASVGLSAWPMSVLADHPDWRAELCSRFGVADDRRLVNVLRVGPTPSGAELERARIPAKDLIL